MTTATPYDIGDDGALPLSSPPSPRGGADGAIPLSGAPTRLPRFATECEQLAAALGFTPGECDLLRDTLRAEYDRGVRRGVAKGERRAVRVLRAFDPNEKRDSAGKWSKDGAPHQTGAEWRESLTPEEHKEVARFQGGGFAMQKDLRSGSPDATNLARAALMDAAIAKSPGLRADSTLYRGLDFDTPRQAQEFLAGKQVGDEFTDLGYGSTSVDEAYIKTFWRGNEGTRSVRVDIRAPEGTTGAYMSEGGAGHLEHEREFLLARGARYRVDEVKPIGDGGTHLILSLLGTGEKKAFDPNQKRNEHGEWVKDTAADTVVAAPKPDRSITHRDLSDEHRGALAEIARLFPDGIHHLLDDSGRVDERHLEPEPEQATEESLQRADQLRAEWHEVDAGIREKLKYADEVEAHDLADDAANNLVNATLFNGDFDTITSGDRFREENPEIADALGAIGEGLGFVDQIPYGDRPRLPVEEDYTLILAPD